MIYQYKRFPDYTERKTAASWKDGFFRSGDNVIQEKTEGIPASPHIDSANNTVSSDEVTAGAQQN